LHGAGKNPLEISVAMGRAYSSVAAVLHRRGGVRPDSPKRSPLRLSPHEREEISRGVSAREAFAVIAGRIDRSPSTVSREVARNGGRRSYRACTAERHALERARRPKPAKLAGSPALRAQVEVKLGLHWAPQQIASWLRTEYPDDPAMWVSHETIYTTLFMPSKQDYPPGCAGIRAPGAPSDAPDGGGGASGEAKTRT